MKRLFICATALGLFMAMPAMSAPNDNHNGDKHDTVRSDANAHAASGNAQQNAPARTTMGAAITRTGGTTHNTPTLATTGLKLHSTSVASHQNTLAIATTGPANSRTGSSNSRRAMSGNAFSANKLSNTGSVGNTAHRNGFVQTNPVAAAATVNTRSTNVVRSNSSAVANATTRNRSIASLRINVQSSHQFHDGNYSQPVGYQVRHWGYGDRLPNAYFARNYWIADFLMFGLFAPPEGLVWVRVGDDALLIDEYTGEVVQVDYGVFY